MSDANSREALRAQIELALESALKQAMAYAFNKGNTNDRSPDHDKANAIRDKALDAIMSSIDEYVGGLLKREAEALDFYLRWRDDPDIWGRIEKRRDYLRVAQSKAANP